MAGTAPADSTAQARNFIAPPRVPKLAVRNLSAEDQSRPSNAPHNTAEIQPVHHATSSTRSTLDDPAVSPPGTSSSDPSTSNPRSSTSSNLASNASSANISKTQKKKKGNPVLGFLALKEPSQSALEQFAESQRKQAAEKGAKNSTATFAGQKLPSTVPKVNSKWDGLPEALKAKEAASRKRESMLSTRTRTGLRSSSSNASQFTSESVGSRIPTNSLASSIKSSSSQRSPSLHSFVSSQGSQHKDAVSRFSNVPTFDPVAAGLKVRTSIKSPSMSSLPTISYYFPDDPQGKDEKVEASLETSPPPSSHSPQLTGLDGTYEAEVVAPMDLPSNPSDKVDESRDSGVDIEFSNAELVNAQAILKRISKGYQGFLAGEAQELKLPGEEDENSIHGRRSIHSEDQEAEAEPRKEDVHNVESTSPREYQFPIVSESALAPSDEPAPELAPAPAPVPVSPPTSPRPKNFSRPLSYQPPPGNSTAHRQSTSAYTVHPLSVGISADEASIAESAAQDFAPMDPEHTRNISSSHSKAPSIAPSVTPSEMSAQWFRSPRERLGLGGRIKKSDSVPWEKDEGSPNSGKKKTSRLSMFVKNNS